MAVLGYDGWMPARLTPYSFGGRNPYVISRMPSGWALIGDVQVLPGSCLLLPDPVVHSLNDLSAANRASYLLDMVRLGDAMLKATGASRIN